MNLNRIVLLALAAQVAAIGTAGCKSSTTADAPATEGSADEAAAAADLVRGKDSREPAVRIRGLERHVIGDDGPGVSALVRDLSLDLFQ